MELSELLKSLELSDEMVDRITSEMATNGIYTTSEENIDVRFNKMKSERDQARADLTAKEEEVTTLTATIEERDETIASHADSSTDLEELRTQLEEANNGRTKLERSHKLEALLRKSGATDTEYMTYKLGGVDALEVDEEGNFTGIDERLNELKEQHPKYFGVEETPVGGYQVIDNKLPEGKTAETDPFSNVLDKYKD